MDFIKRFDIELDKTTYYAGEILTGQVVVENIENIKVQGIRVFIRGKSHCQWKVTRAGEKRTVKEDEYYIDHKQLLWGKPSSEEGPVPILPRGHHKLPIEYQIPETNLPCSFESKIGRIRYYLRVVINIPYASHPQGIKYFSVIGPHIDCMDSNYLTPTTATDKRQSCCFCLFGGPVVIKSVLERSAYCCGEKIKLKAEVQNGCDQKVWLICRLMQHVEYFINRGVLGMNKNHSVKIWEYQSENVQPHVTVVFDQLQEHLQVPVTPPTLLNVCSLVNIYYELTISLGMERSREDLEICFPLTVATVPFRIPNTPIPQLQFEYAAENVEGGMYISPEFQLGQVYMGDDDEENDETILYRPVYCAVPHHDVTVTNTNNASLNPCGGRSPRLGGHSPRIQNKSPMFTRQVQPTDDTDDGKHSVTDSTVAAAGCSGEQTKLLAVSRIAEITDSVDYTGESSDSCTLDETLEYIREPIHDDAVRVSDITGDLESMHTEILTTSSAVMSDAPCQTVDDDDVLTDTSSRLLNHTSHSPVRSEVRVSATESCVHSDVTKTVCESVTVSYAKYQSNTNTIITEHDVNYLSEAGETFYKTETVETVSESSQTFTEKSEPYTERVKETTETIMDTLNHSSMCDKTKAKSAENITLSRLSEESLLDRGDHVKKAASSDPVYVETRPLLSEIEQLKHCEL